MVTPTIQRRRLGHALKQAREAAGKTQEEAAIVIDAAASKVSRLELGQSRIRLTDLNLLLDFYQVAAEPAAALRELARAGRERGRWGTYRDAIPGWFRQYVDLEAGASEIRWYQPEIIPDILQIEPYIRAMTVSTRPFGSAEDVDRQVAVRRERQTVIDRPDGPTLRFVLSESALRRNVGGSATMRDQLRHLVDLGNRPNVELRVFPLDAPTYQTASYGFVILRLGDDTRSDVIYVESYTGADYLDRPDTVRAYTRLWDGLRAAALGPAQSRRLMTRLAEEIDRREAREKRSRRPRAGSYGAGPAAATTPA